ncbi:MAG: hypothetical protein Q8P81_01705 [Nanoarchaeota archaeon]|nr:hypothetical protein [Nanoarchaeota archaeon]
MSEEIEVPVKYIVIALIAIGVVALFFVFGKTGTGFAIGGVSEGEARDNLLSFFAREIPDSSVEILSTSKQGTFYRFDIAIDGESVPIYVTEDGEYMTVDIVPLK